MILLLLLVYSFPAYAQWVTLNTGSVTNFHSVYFLDANTGFAVGDSAFSSGVVLKTTNGGVNWTRQSVGVPNNSHQSVFFVDANTGYIADGEGGVYANIYATTNGGANWVQQFSSPNYGLQSIFFVNAQTGFAAGSFKTGGSFVFRTTSGGTNWNPQSFGSKPLYSVFFTDALTGYAAGGDNFGVNGVIIKTTNAGSSWTILSQSVYGLLLSVYFPSAQVGYAVGGIQGQSNSIIVKSTNAGLNWTAQTSPLNSKLNSVYFSDINNGYAVGDSGKIIRTTDGGDSWLLQASGSLLALNSIKFVNSLTGYIGGGGYNSSILLKTTNGGLTYIVPVTTEIPEKFGLFQNYPNPFNPSTMIRFDIPKTPLSFGEGNAPMVRGVRLVIFDILGREVNTLVNENFKPGTYEVEWKADNYPSGVYFYTITGNDFNQTRKMVLIK